MTDGTVSAMSISDEQWLAFLVDCEAKIAAHGWMIQGVFAVEEDQYSWQYTIGLERKGRAELIVVGLPYNVGGTLLNDVAKDYVADPDLIVHGAVLDGYLRDGFVLEVVAVEDPRLGDWFNVASSLRGGKDGLEVFQLVWPEKNGQHRRSTLQPVLNWTWQP